MAGHHCNVVFGNYHGLFPESSRAQIHSVRSMSSLLSAYPIPDADFSFFFISCLSPPFPPLIYTPPDRRTFERRQRMSMKRGSGKKKKMKRTRNTLRWRGLSLSSAMRELEFHCTPGVHCTSSPCYHGSSLVESCFANFESKLS